MGSFEVKMSKHDAGSDVKESEKEKFKNRKGSSRKVDISDITRYIAYYQKKYSGLRIMLNGDTMPLPPSVVENNALLGDEKTGYRIFLKEFVANDTQDKLYLYLDARKIYRGFNVDPDITKFFNCVSSLYNSEINAAVLDDNPDALTTLLNQPEHAVMKEALDGLIAPLVKAQSFKYPTGDETVKEIVLQCRNMQHKEVVGYFYAPTYYSPNHCEACILEKNAIYFPLRYKADFLRDRVARMSYESVEVEASQWDTFLSSGTVLEPGKIYFRQVDGNVEYITHCMKHPDVITPIDFSKNPDATNILLKRGHILRRHPDIPSEFNVYTPPLFQYDDGSLHKKDCVPQADNESCGTMAILNLKKLLKESAKSFHELTFQFLYYGESGNLEGLFIPSADTLHYSQSRNYNSALIAMVTGDEDTFRIDVPGKGYIEHLTIAGMLRKSIEEAGKNENTALAIENQKKLEQLPAFRERWMTVARTELKEHAEMQTDIGNVELAWHAHRLYKKTRPAAEEKQPAAAKLVTRGIFPFAAESELSTEVNQHQQAPKKPDLI